MRQATYRLLGTLFRYPSAELTASARALAAELRPAGEPFRPFPFHARWRSLLAAVLGLGEEARARLEEEYLELFLLGGRCPLHESAQLGGEVAWPHVAAEVAGAYAAAGVTLAPEAAGELPDHVGLELEFLSLLAAEEALAWLDGREPEALGRLELEEAFLDEHLGRWLPALASRLAAVSAPASLYRQLGEVAHAFVAHDRDLVAALAARAPVRA